MQGNANDPRLQSQSVDGDVTVTDCYEQLSLLRLRINGRYIELSIANRPKKWTYPDRAGTRGVSLK